jgi:hypothetical protein
MTSDLQTVLNKTEFLKPEEDLASLAGQIKAEFDQINPALLGGFRTALGHAFKVGELLTKAKAKLKAEVGHGQWLDWVEEHCPFVGVRTAQVYMQLHRNRDKIEADANAQSAALFKCLSVHAALGILAGKLEADEDDADGEAGDDKPDDGDSQEVDPEAELTEKSDKVQSAENRYCDYLTKLSDLDHNAAQECASRLVRRLRNGGLLPKR